MLELFTDDLRRNPFGAYAQMRAAAPAFYLEQADLWLIFDYDGVKRALADVESFASDPREAGHPAPPWFVFYDPPRHTKLRALVSKAFTPRMIAGLEGWIRELSRQLLDRVVDRREMDLVNDYAAQLPMKVIARMIGIAEEKWEQFRAWSEAILALSHTVRGLSPDAQANAAGEQYISATTEMGAYLRGELEARKSHPRDDLLAGLLNAEVDGERLSFEETLGFFQLLLVAGQETTANLISGAMVCLLDNPAEMQRLRERMELLPSAIEEALRYRAPVQWMFRATRREVEISGAKIPAKKLVLTVIGSANRDERVFADAGRFDTARDPNPHLAFGHGSHFCLGAALARMEARIALTDLLTRLGRIELASAEPWPPRKALHVHGPSRLEIAFAR